MVEGGACLVALVLEDQDVLEAVVPIEVVHPVAIGPDQGGYIVMRQVGQLDVVQRRLGNHLVRADSRHHIVQADALALEIPLDAQGRVLVRQHADGPAGVFGAVPGARMA